MDTVLHGSGALNGLDLALWIGFLVVAPRILRWGYAPRKTETTVVESPPQVVEELRPAGRPAQLKLAV